MNKQHKEIEKNAKAALALIIIITCALLSVSVYLIVINAVKPELTFTVLTMVPTIILAKNQIKLNSLISSQQDIEKDNI